MTDDARITREKFEAYLTPETWSPYRQAIANLFNAHYTAALTKENIEKACQALYGLPEGADLGNVLRELVRAKVLRSRSAHGKRYWEVNY